MLPADLASFRVVDGQLLPDWLGPEDHPWLRDLLDRVVAAEGSTVRELDQRLRQPLARAAPPARLKMAVEVARRWVTPEKPETPVDPAALRKTLFLASSVRRRGGTWTREASVADAGRTLELGPAEVEAHLLSDLPSERIVRLPQTVPTPAELALRTNLALAQSLLQRAVTMDIAVFGSSRDLVRHVRLRGLICVVRRSAEGLRLEVSGPFALFRRTTLYGRAYASIVPRLPWCERFALHARCTVRGVSAALRLGPADPIYPSPPPRQFDSKLEEAFARELAKRFPDWALVREPEPVEVEGTLSFPDFALFRVAEPERRWLVEIVGFWTPEYLRAKLERLRRTPGWIVAIDRRLNCDPSDLPDTVGVVWFERKVRPADVLALTAALPPIASVERALVTRSLGVGCYFLDWAGRRPGDDPVHARLAALAPEAEARLVARDGHCFVTDAQGRPVAALSARERDRWAPHLDRIRAVKVRRVVARTRADSGPAFRDRLRVERWLVPLVDVVFLPSPP